MRKLLSLCVIVALFLMVGCALLKFVGQPQLQTYTFNYDGGEYSALLPKEVPMPPEDAQLNPYCLPWGICGMHVQYMAGKEPIPRYPVATFWFTKERGIIALVWHTLKDGIKKHNPFLYLKGLPVPTTSEAIEELLTELPSPKQ